MLNDQKESENKIEKTRKFFLDSSIDKCATHSDLIKSN